MDPQLLATLVTPDLGLLAAELGAGEGEATLSVAKRHPTMRLHGLEIRPQCVEIASRLAAPLGDRVSFFSGDLKAPPRQMVPGSYDQIFFNPPYFPSGQGRLPPDGELAMSRFELTATLDDFLAATHYLLKPGGWYHFIFLPRRLGELFSPGQPLSPARVIPVLPRPGREAVRVLVSGRKGKRHPLALWPPLCLGDQEGREPATLRALLQEGIGAAFPSTKKYPPVFQGRMP